MALTPKQRKKALEEGMKVKLSSADEQQYVPPTPQAAKNFLTRQPSSVLSEESQLEKSASLPADRKPDALPAYGRPSAPSDGRPVVLPAGRKPELPTDRRPKKSLKTSLPADRKPDAINSSQKESIPLAPVQWTVFEALKKAEQTGQIISRRKLAQAANASVRGIRDALAVLERVGGIRSKVTVRTAEQQGIRVKLDHSIAFRLATQKETKGLLQRETHYRPTVGRETAALPADRRCMYVCKRNTYIQAEDLASLLRLSPAGWEIREQTLIQIADAFPTMTALEFRLSLKRLVEQANTGKPPIQNPNAWLKAAFEKNAGPLVTEREVEARLDQPNEKQPQEQPVRAPQSDESQDLEILRRYVGASPEERTQIDHMAEERAAPLLAAVAADKHAGIREQAKIEYAREFFGRDG